MNKASKRFQVELKGWSDWEFWFFNTESIIINITMDSAPLKSRTICLSFGERCCITYVMKCSAKCGNRIFIYSVKLKRWWNIIIYPDWNKVWWRWWRSINIRLPEALVNESHYHAPQHLPKANEWGRKQYFSYINKYDRLTCTAQELSFQAFLCRVTATFAR